MKAALLGMTLAILTLSACLGLERRGGALVVREIETPAPTEGSGPGWLAAAISPAARAAAATAVPPPPRDLAYVRDGELWVADADGARARRLTEGGADSQPGWSSDGQRIVFIRGSGPRAEIYVIRADGSELHRLTDDALEQTTPRWSPRGGLIAYVQARDANADGRAETGEGYEIWLTSEDGRSSRRVAVGFDPAWSPDGGRLAYITGGSSRGEGGAAKTPPALHVLDVDRQQDRRVLSLSDIPDDLAPGFNLPFRPALRGLRAPTWSADGQLLALSADGHTSVVIMVGLDGTVLHVLAPTYEGEVGRAIFAPRGSALAVERRPASGYGQVVLLDPADGRARATLGGEQLDFSAREPAWSPDGQLLALVVNDGADSDRAPRRELLVFGADGSVRSRVTSGAVAQPTWNPQAAARAGPVSERRN